jgi:hypothetical protein
MSPAPPANASYRYDEASRRLVDPAVARMADFDRRVTALVRGDDTGPQPVARALVYRYLKRVVARLTHVLTAAVNPVDRLDELDEKTQAAGRSVWWPMAGRCLALQWPLTLVVSSVRMPLGVSRLILLLCCSSLVSAGPAVAQNVADGTSQPVVAAVVARDPITLDGRLDERDWATATAVVLTQQSPAPLQPTPYDTIVRVLIDDNTLYVGFAGADPDPHRLMVQTKERDGEVVGDDTFAVVLDSHGDRRTGFYFRTNAAGARIDGLIATAGEPSLDWDGIWDVRTHRHTSGWSAEFAIPVQSLSFTPGLAAWGINFERFVARDQTTLRWSSPTLDSLLTDLSRAGLVSGTADLRQGRGLDISPYLTGRTVAQFGSNERTSQVEPGIDAAWRLTPQLALVLTANTDFAEAEADSRQLNVTRFPLFFPERRAFFLEGATQYDFGLGLDGSNFLPFFSRRVGVFEGGLAPVDVGAKLNGRLGRLSLGVLGVQTRDSEAAPGTRMLAGRAAFDVTPEWQVGTIMTHGHPNAVEHNTLVGADTRYRTSSFRGDKNLEFGGWAVASAGDLDPGNRTGWGVRFDYPNDLWDCRLETLHFGDGLNPGLGFLRRPGTRQYEGGCAFQPRPARNGQWRQVRQTMHALTYRRVDRFVSGETESWSLETAPVDVQFDSGDAFTFTLTPQGERLFEPFDIADDVRLPVGAYRFTRASLAVASGSHRRWSATAGTEFGGFFEGTLLQVTASLGWSSPTGAWRSALGVERNRGVTPYGDFEQRLWQISAAYAASPDLTVSSFAQYDTDSRQLSSNVRLRWTLTPGNDLFVVWNRGWERTTLRPSLTSTSELVAVKLRWTFRL